MFLFDSNIWVARTFRKHSGHVAATAALARISVQNPAVFCRATQHSFLRLISTPTVQRQYGALGTTNDIALQLLQQLLALPGVEYHDEPAGLETTWHALARRQTASPKVWMDAYLAAFAMASGLTVVTFDADYRQYEPAGLKLELLPIP